MSDIGVRRDGYLVTTLDASGETGETVLNVSSGKSFMMTDLICSVGPLAATDVTTSTGIQLFDAQQDGGTVQDSADRLMTLYCPVISASTGMKFDQPIVITGLANGPEFGTEVSVTSIMTTSLATGAVWVGG
ncbi:hypothetical protein LCGC14_2921230, partial [marine sediment metagenome]